MIDEIAKLIEENPNDAFLGRKLRDLYHNNQDRMIVVMNEGEGLIRIEAYTGIDYPEMGIIVETLPETFDFIQKINFWIRTPIETINQLHSI